MPGRGSARGPPQTLRLAAAPSRSHVFFCRAYLPKNQGFFGLGLLHLTPARCGEQSVPSFF